MKILRVVVGLLLLITVSSVPLKRINLSPGLYVLDSTVPTLKNVKTEFNFTDNHVSFKQCNVHGCSFSQDGLRINITQCMSTLMYCEGSHQVELSNIVDKVDRVKVRGRYYILYSSKDKDVQLRLRKIRSSLSSSSPTSKVFPTGTYLVQSTSRTFKNLQTKLVFEKETLHFKQCNYYNCGWKQSGKTLKIEECAGTKMFCQGSQENKLVSFLQNVNSWKQKGDVYTLISGFPRRELTLKKIE